MITLLSMTHAAVEHSAGASNAISNLITLISLNLQLRKGAMERLLLENHPKHPITGSPGIINNEINNHNGEKALTRKCFFTRPRALCRLL